MRTRAALFLILTLLAVIGHAAEKAADTPKEGLCPVCKVHEGEAKPEPVKASSVYKGQTYGFCSEKCKTAFDSYPEAYIPPVLPRPVPAFTVKTLDGKEVPFTSFASGKPVLLDFWATWCAPCVSAMPELQKLHQRHAAKGFSVVGISIDEEHPKARKFAQKKKLAYPVYLDATATPAWSVFHVRAIPAVFLIDAEGRIVQQWLGKVDMKEVEQAVARLVG
ncbi:MAG TPA: redoxin domain-containing protein [Thermoanaerobaculia bacterium]|jgi:thiol-disulfide isomerase/thioredoxin|nr:redoxin domain-containing protein [Thermoanaerobaculia bacterium]